VSKAANVFRIKGATFCCKKELILFYFDNTGGPPLDGDHWHVTERYNDIRAKVKEYGTQGTCVTGFEGFPARACALALHGRTQHTPRANPEKTALTTIIRPTSDGYVPSNELKMLFEGPDGHNTCYDTSDGQIDVHAIVSGRRLVSTQESIDDRRTVRIFQEDVARNLENEIKPGKGWQLIDEKPGVCDGGYYSICGRAANDNCPSLAHHDSRGLVVGNEFAGWIIFDVPKVENGFILLRLVTWLLKNANPRTNGWTSVNNERRQLRDGLNQTISFVYGRADHYNPEDPFNIEKPMPERRIELKDMPDTLRFEYAINGKITSLDKTELQARIIHPERVVELLTLLDDPNFSSSPVVVEVAVRIVGCGQDCVFGLSHLYWS
jgi:hypothetical protein